MVDMQDFKPKKFLDRPEGWTGIIFGLGGIAGAGFIFIKALPYLINILQNTLYAVGLGVVLIAVLAILLDKKNWILASAMYQSAMRAITGIFVTIDPIGIIENYIRNLKKKAENIDKQLANLKGQIVNVRNSIEDATKAMKSALSTAQFAEKKGDKNNAALNAKEVKRQKDFIDNLTVISSKMEFLYRILSKILENSEVLITDTEREVEMKKKERAMWKTTSSAIASAQSIIVGNPDDKALFEMSMEAVAKDISQKTGEMERFVDRTQKIMATIDLRDGVMQEEGLKLLASMENESGNFLISDKDKKKVLAQTASSSEVLNLDEDSEVENKYVKLSQK